MSRAITTAPGMGYSLGSDLVPESHAENLLSRVTSTTKTFRLDLKQSLNKGLQTDT